MTALGVAEIGQPPELPAFDEILRALVDPPDRRERQETKRVCERQTTRSRRRFRRLRHPVFDTAGAEQLIEVKTTGYGAYTPFYVTWIEVVRSNEDSDRYHLYRVFAFQKQPKLFRLPGPVDRSCQLDPAQYVARVG